MAGAFRDPDAPADSAPGGRLMANPAGRVSTDLVTAPRSSVEEAWMDVTATAIAIREDLGKAHEQLLLRREPRPHLFTADARLTRLIEYGRRHAAEAAVITYIHQDQLALFDGA